ncbi:MAG TPA: ABC transporter, partial [Clostridiaceae bacterium]|nr:ABC transporter [Clostridiaceae bacterium]
NAGKKNEEMKLKSMASSIVLFALSIVMLGTAYVLVLKIGLLTESVLIAVSILLGVFGTLLFFFSLSSFFIHWMKRQKSLYLKSLRIFVLRQVHNKINSNFLSMSAICLMLFLTITLLFT